MAITEKYASSAGAGAKDGTSEGAAWDFATMLTNAAAGDRINFKGNHTLTGNATFTNAGSATSPIILRGYSSTIGDGYLGRTDNNGPLITTNMPVITGGAYNITMPNFSIIESMSVTSTRSVGAIAGGSYCAIVRCLANNSGTGSGSTGINTGQYSLAFDCDAKLSGASGGAVALDLPGNCYAVACRADGGQAVGIRLSAATAAILCTAYSSGTDAILGNSTSNTYLILGCTAVTSTSDGFHQVAAPTRLSFLINNLLADNGAYGIYAVDAASGVFSACNRIDRNSSGADNGATDWLDATSYSINTTSLTQANEFPGYASDDYRLGPTSTARQNGAPSYFDIGALQRIEDYPSAANVLTSDTVDGVAGTFDESARNTDPGEANVKSGTSYKIQNVAKSGSYSAGGGIFMPAARQIGV